jgi:cytoskeletal protein CcmA (bactofilin family)
MHAGKFELLWIRSLELVVFVVGPGIRIWGMINSGEPAEVRGFVDGSIIAPAVHVLTQAMVVGDLVAAEVIIEGQVQGNVFANKLVLEPSCHVEGEIYHADLELREGAYFEGKSRHHPKPRSLAPTLALTDISIPS